MTCWDVAHDRALPWYLDPFLPPVFQTLVNQGSWRKLENPLQSSFQVFTGLLLEWLGGLCQPTIMPRDAMRFLKDEGTSSIHLERFDTDAKFCVNEVVLMWRAVRPSLVRNFPPPFLRSCL